MKRALWLSLVMAAGFASPGGATPAAEASWPVLNRCVDDPLPVPGSGANFRRESECREAVWTIVVSGADADRERLWSLFDGLPERSLVASTILAAFLDHQVERALSTLEASPPVPAGGATPAWEVDVEVPAFLQSAAPELRQAWRTYQGVVAKARRPLGAPDTIDFPSPSSQVSFRRTIVAFLRGSLSAAAAARELSRYAWGSWCGTSSDMLYDPKSKALLVAYLQLGQIDLALASSTGLGSSWFGTEMHRVGWDRGLIAAARVDWERFYLGGVLSGRRGMAALLGRQGSERAARQLVAAVRLVEATEPESAPARDSLLDPLAALVEPSGGCSAAETWHLGYVERDRGAEAIGGDIQADVLDLLAGKFNSDTGLYEALALSELLVRLCRPESRPAFQAMLRSPYERVRQWGAIGLRALGDTVADPPSQRVAFRVVVDGKPAAPHRLEWGLKMRDFGQQSSSAPLDDAGIVRLGRDPFLDPGRPVTWVQLGAPDLLSTQDVWFSVSLPPPADLDAVTTVAVSTGSLTVTIPPSLMAEAGSKRPILRLMAETTRYGTKGVSETASSDLPVVSTSMTFPRLQHGRYRAWLDRAGRLYASPAVDVGASPVTVSVRER